MSLPDDGAEAHNAFNPDTHHNPSMNCALFEKEDTEVNNRKARRQIRDAFLGQTRFTFEQLIEFCKDLLSIVEFSKELEEK